MPEVFILCEYPTLNGGERSMLATLGHIRSSGFSPVVIAPPEGPLADELAARDVEVLPFQIHSLDGNRLPRKTLQGYLERTLSARRPALLHANSLSMGRLSGPVAERLGLPSIAHLRDIIKLNVTAIADLNLHRRLLAVSRATRDFHIAGGISTDKIHVLYNGVNIDEFCPSPPTGYLHRELGLPADAKLIGTIGQIGLRKGQDVLLLAAATIAIQFPDVHYLIVGERNSEKEESRRYESDLRNADAGLLAGRVHFLGRRYDIPSLLRELTLLAHPARQEPLGRVLLEAAAAGTPVVATAVGGTREIFLPYKHAGHIVKSDDPHALSAAIARLLNDEALRRGISAASMRRAVTIFDSQSAAKNLLKHYSAVT